MVTYFFSNRGPSGGEGGGGAFSDSRSLSLQFFDFFEQRFSRYLARLNENLYALLEVDMGGSGAPSGPITRSCQAALP